MIRFEIAKAEDASPFLELMKMFYAIDRYPFDLERTEKNFHELIKNKSLGRIWLVKDDGVPIGYIILTFGFSMEYGGSDAFIDEFFLVEAYRGKGIGDQMMAYLLEQCQILKIKAIHLEVERHNKRGARLYLKNGFELNDRQLLTKIIR